MSRRSALLAQRIEQGADILADFAEELSDAQWHTVVQSDGRQVGVIVHHVASVYPIEIDLAKRVASGKDIAGLTWGSIAELNAKHAHDHDEVGRQETIDLLRRNGHSAAEAVSSFSDEELDRAAPISLNADAPLTAQFLIEEHALRHSWHHLAKIKAAVGMD
jgi:hypothetical protein